MIGQKVLVSGLVAALAVVLAVPGAAAPFSLLREGEDRAWVVDGDGGTVAFCELVEKRGPKVVDVFGETGQPRPGRERGAEPVCTEVLEAAGRPADGAVAVFAVPAFRQVVSHRFYGRFVELERAPDRIVTVARPNAAGFIELAR